jgi:TonB family protein
MRIRLGLASVVVLALGIGACGAKAARSDDGRENVVALPQCEGELVGVDTLRARTTTEGVRLALLRLGWATPTVTVVPIELSPVIRNRSVVQRELVDSYPRELRDRGVGGEVRYAVLIDPAGRVAQRHITESSGAKPLDLAGGRVLDRMELQPATYEDCRIASWDIMPISFRVW